MKHASSLLLAAAAGLAAAAQSPVVTVLIPGVDKQSVDGSIISVGPTATSFFVACPTGTPSEDCGLLDGFEILYGPSTMNYGMTYSDGTSTEIYSADCTLDPAKDVATCTGFAAEPGQTTSTFVEVLTAYSTYLLPVTITAGAEKLSAGADSSSADSASSTVNNPGAVPTTLSTTASGSAATGGSSASTAASTAASSSTRTGGMPRVTQNAVIMGAAALVGGAMLI